MITVTKGKDFSRTFQNRQLADVCLHYAGGGYTASQTSAAMAALRTVMDGKSAKINGFKIVMTEDVK